MIPQNSSQQTVAFCRWASVLSPLSTPCLKTVLNKRSTHGHPASINVPAARWRWLRGVQVPPQPASLPFVVEGLLKMALEVPLSLKPQFQASLYLSSPRGTFPGPAGPQGSPGPPS